VTGESFFSLLRRIKLSCVMSAIVKIFTAKSYAFSRNSEFVRIPFSFTLKLPEHDAKNGYPQKFLESLPFVTPDL
jgi:hypothetical protein